MLNSGGSNMIVLIQMKDKSILNLNCYGYITQPSKKLSWSGRREVERYTFSAFFIKAMEALGPFFTRLAIKNKELP